MKIDPPMRHHILNEAVHAPILSAGLFSTIRASTAEIFSFPSFFRGVSPARMSRVMR